MFEPIFYLLALGLGLGSYITGVTDAQGNVIPYAAFIAPALLAVSAMNGAIYDSTWNVCADDAMILDPNTTAPGGTGIFRSLIAAKFAAPPSGDRSSPDSRAP